MNWPRNPEDPRTPPRAGRWPRGCGVVMLLVGALPAAADLQVEVTRLDGSTVTGTWSAAAAAGQIAVRTATRQLEFSPQDLLELRFVDNFLTSEGSDWSGTLWTADGSRFPADILDGAFADALAVRTPFAERAVLEPNQIAAWQWNRQGSDADLEQHLRSASDTQDLLLAVDGSKTRVLAGAVEAFSSEGGEFRYRDRVLRFGPDNTLGVIFSTAARPAPTAVRCELSEGYRIAGVLAGTTADTLLLRCFGDLEVRIAAPMIRRLTFHSDRLVFLSDLEPSNTRQHNLLGLPWPVRRNASVTNQPMSMAGHTYARGLGVHAHSEVTFTLKRDYRALAATIGIDDAVRPAGSVVFRVVGDGRELYRSPLLDGQDAPRNMVVPLDGIRSLQLVVEPGAQLDIGDHANWANIRLIQ